MNTNTETAILARACLWSAQELLRHREGVIATRVGYTGGKNVKPTAEHHPGRAEAVEVISIPSGPPTAKSGDAVTHFSSATRG